MPNHIGFLINQGNVPATKDLTFDKSGIGTFQFIGPVDIDALQANFDFPPSISIGQDYFYGGGVIWDRSNGLKIHRER